MARSGDPLTLSRQDLYELVWAKPMTELAQDFGLSDVALAKRCRKLAVPVPGRGYWARVAAGQTPRQPALRKRAEQPMDCTALTFDAPREETPQLAPGEPPDQNPLRDKVQNLGLVYCDDLLQSSPAVKRTAVRLKPPWRRDIAWNRGERNGPVLSVDVSEACADRALRVCERILTGATALGWAYRIPSKKEDPRSHRYRHESDSETPAFGCFDVEGEPLALRIDERNQRIEHVLTDDEKARKRRGVLFYSPRWDHRPSGELRLHLTRADSTYVRRTWKDGARLKLEDQVKTVLLALLDEALAMKAERERQRLAEIERRRQENLEMEQSARRAANAKLVQALETQAGAWLRARFLRSYLRALRRAVGNATLETERQGHTIDFIQWAQHYVDQLDPLRATPCHAARRRSKARAILLRAERCESRRGVEPFAGSTVGRSVQNRCSFRAGRRLTGVSRPRQPSVGEDHDCGRVHRGVSAPYIRGRTGWT
jgi:hypothetical protein